MTQEDKELLLKDLCARLPHGIKFLRKSWNFEWDQELSVIEILEDIDKDGYINRTKVYNVEDIKPYLFPFSSMTEEEAKELSILYGIKDILSIKITDEYIDFEVDDGFCSIETKTIWYNEIISSIKTFDWCNKNHLDYRGLIEKGLAIDATNLNVY